MKAAIATDCGHIPSGHARRRKHLFMALFSFVFVVLIAATATSPAFAQKKDGSPQTGAQAKAGKKSGQKKSASQKKIVKKKVVKKKDTKKVVSKKPTRKKVAGAKPKPKSAKKTATSKTKKPKSGTKSASSRQNTKKKSASNKSVKKKKPGSKKAGASNKKTRSKKAAASNKKTRNEKAVAKKRDRKKSAKRKQTSRRKTAKKRVSTKSGSRKTASARRKAVARKRIAARKSRAYRTRHKNIRRYGVQRRYPAPHRQDALAAIIEGAAFAIAFQNEQKMVRPRPVPLPPRPVYPGRRSAVDADQATGYELEQTLTAPPPTPVERTYSLDEMRSNGDWHGRLNRVDLKSITFATDSAQVDNYEIPKLADLAGAMHRIIARNPEEVFMVSGHTDLEGSALYNLELSDRRAEAITNALTRFYAISPQNLVTQGYGEQYPVIPTPYAERENRRVSVQRVTPILQTSRH